MQIDFYLLKQMPSLNLNPEVHFRLYGRHLIHRVSKKKHPLILLAIS